MFRLFLIDRLEVGKGESEGQKSGPSRTSKQRDRRLHNRYNVSQQQLTDMNEQDILMVKDISPKGFASDVSQQAYERFTVGDVFSAKLRYLEEVFDLDVRVAWKRHRSIGLEMTHPSETLESFLIRIMEPMAKSKSLSEKEFEWDNENAPDVWFQGQGVHILIWKVGAKAMTSWQILFGDQYVLWQANHGLRTGSLQLAKAAPTDIPDFSGYSFNEDGQADPAKITYASDLLIAFMSAHQNELIDTLLQAKHELRN